MKITLYLFPFLIFSLVFGQDLNFKQNKRIESPTYVEMNAFAEVLAKKIILGKTNVIDDQDLKKLSHAQETIVILSSWNGKQYPQKIVVHGQNFVDAFNQIISKLKNKKSDETQLTTLSFVTDIMPKDFIQGANKDNLPYIGILLNETNQLILPIENRLFQLIRSEKNWNAWSSFMKSNQLDYPEHLPNDHNLIFVREFVIDNKGKVLSIRKLPLERGLEIPFVEDVINLQVNYIVNSTLDNGQFVYDYDITWNKSNNDYNILRHAGTVYSLIKAYEHRKTDALKSAIERSVGYLKRSLVVSRTNPEILLVPQINRIVLGGNALALLALSKYSEIFNDMTILPTLTQLANGIESFQDASGRLKADYNDQELVSNSFYPGEAIYALSQYYKVDPNPKWMKIAFRGIDYIIESHKNDIEYDHWLEYGVNEWDKIKPNEKYVNYALKGIDSLINKKLPPQNPNYIHINTIGLGTKNEGLSQALEMAVRYKKKELVAKIQKYLIYGLNLQLNSYMWPEKSMWTVNPQFSLGSVANKTNTPTCRIDGPQHTMSAFIEYFEFLQNNPN